MEVSENLPDLSNDELIALNERLVSMLEERGGAGVHVSFPGRTKARRISSLVRPRVQKFIPELSVGSAEAQANNLLIEGDNLQALASLYKWREQVDLILTDPPYNTGNDFRYNDRWDDDPNDSGLGEFVREDDTAKHTKWMRFMYPRLKLMQEMLRPTGVLAICIDHRELFHLGQMLDELFDEKNRLAIINWQKTAAPRSDSKHVSTSTEYVLVYAKDKERLVPGRLDRSESSNRRYGNPDEDPLGLWREANLTARTYSEKDDYAIQSPLTGELHYPAGSGVWRHPKKNLIKWLSEWGTPYVEKDIGDGRMKALVPAGSTVTAIPATVRKRAEKILAAKPWPFVWFGQNGQGRPRVKTYLEQIRKGAVPVTYWADDDLSPLDIGSTSWGHKESGRSSDGIAELTAVVGPGHNFETVKPLRLMQKIIQLWCPKDGIVVDPFAGSGTTAHAVMALNATQDADRRFILMEQGRPEKGDSYSETLTANRLRRVIAGDWANGKGSAVPGGFGYQQLTTKVDADTLLEMERDEMVDTVLASHFDGNKRRGSLIKIHGGYSYLVGRNKDFEGFYLVWGGSDENANLTEAVYETCADEAEKEGLMPVYHVYARNRVFDTEDVRFNRIPDQILIDFGLDLKSALYEGASE